MTNMKRSFVIDRFDRSRTLADRFEMVGIAENRHIVSKLAQRGFHFVVVQVDSAYSPCSNSALLNLRTLQFSFTARCTLSSKPVSVSA